MTDFVEKVEESYDILHFREYGIKVHIVKSLDS